MFGLWGGTQLLGAVWEQDKIASLSRQRTQNYVGFNEYVEGRLTSQERTGRSSGREPIAA